MEDINWNALAERSERPIFRPSLVKVSHHGSSNGRIDGMWPKDGGFFYGLPDNAIAVVTPWRNGDNFLPEENVLQEICEAGYSVYVTGHSGAMGSRSRDGDSHVSVSVESDGAAAVFEQNKVRVLRPPQPEFEI
jgi:beta-lactamase superfamily II metal-dependent hydrolase